MMKYKISNIINSNIAISQRKADVAYNFVSDKIKSQQIIEISFENIDDCSSLFLNYFLGKLYLEFGYEIVSKLLIITEVNSSIILHKIQNSIKLGTNENLFRLHLNSLNAILS